MGIQNHIENLKAKPEHVRRQAAFWYSFGITAIIFVFWIGSFSSIGSNTKTYVASAVNNAGAPAQSLMASVSSFASSIGSFFTDIKELIFSPKKVIYNE